MQSKTNETWRARAESAWRTAARCAALAQEADKEEREYYIRMRDVWIGLANRCQFLDLPEITKRPRASSKPRRSDTRQLSRPWFHLPTGGTISDVVRREGHIGRRCSCSLTHG